LPAISQRWAFGSNQGDAQGAEKSYIRAQELGDAAGDREGGDRKVLALLAGLGRAGQLRMKNVHGRGICGPRHGAHSARGRPTKEVIALPEAVEKDPNDQRTEHELMLAWNHGGDVKRSPPLPRLGNRDKAAAAYQQMAVIAEKLVAVDPDDKRALGDLGIVRMRVAVVTDGPAQILRFRESIELLEKALMADKRDNFIRLNYAYSLRQ